MHRSSSSSLVARMASAALVLGLAAACESRSAEIAVVTARLTEGCARNSDCGESLVCAFGRCHVQCESSRDCNGQRCISAPQNGRGVCQQEADKVCARHSDCPSTQLCGPDDQCRDECIVARDCRPDQVCVGGVCALEPELVDGKLPSVAPRAECRYASDCPADLVCLRGRCDVECVGNKDCFVSWVCSADTRCHPPSSPGGSGIFRPLSLVEKCGGSGCDPMFDGNLELGMNVGNSIGDIVHFAWLASGRPLRKIGKIGMRWGAAGDRETGGPYSSFPAGTAFTITLGRNPDNPGQDPPPAPWTITPQNPTGGSFSFNAKDLGLIGDTVYHEYILPVPVEARSIDLRKTFNEPPIDTHVLEVIVFEVN